MTTPFIMTMAPTGAPGGVASLDATGQVPSAQTRMLNDRGLWQANTAYAKWDVVSLQGARFVVKTDYISTTFASIVNLVPLGQRTWINAKDYGAQGNGTTDDTAAIQAAIDFAGSLSASTGAGGTVFLPQGYYMISATLTLKKHVWLRGEGMCTTTIKLLTNANCHVVQNASSPDGIVSNADFCGLIDLSIDGNQVNQNGTGTYHGVSLSTNPYLTMATNDSLFDMHHTLQNVRVYRAKGDGFHFNGRSAIQVVNAFAFSCTGYGFFSTFDTNYTHCESDSAGKAGFYLNNGSQRLAVCKAYLSGAVDGISPGFQLDSNANGVSLAACEAQNNKGQGFFLNGCGRVTLAGCVADSNNMVTTNSYPGYELFNSSYNVITGVAWQGMQGSAQVGNQLRALRITGTSTANSVTLSHSGVGVTVQAPLTADSTTAGNLVTVNGAVVTQ